MKRAARKLAHKLHDPLALDHSRLIFEAAACWGVWAETKLVWFKVMLLIWFFVDALAAYVAMKNGATHTHDE